VAQNSLNRVNRGIFLLNRVIDVTNGKLRGKNWNLLFVLKSFFLVPEVCRIAYKTE
jgi:hypothetical protein